MEDKSKDLLTEFQSREDIHHTAKWSAPSPGGVTRLCADENDKKVRDWFRDQLLALGADYKVSPAIGHARWMIDTNQVNATGTQFGVFPGEDNSIPPIAMGSHLDTVATGGKFDGPLGVSTRPLQWIRKLTVDRSSEPWRS